MTAQGAELDAVARVADELRRDVVGDEVTYVVNRNINFTNICYTGCRFCAFAQRRSDADAYSLSIDEVVMRAAEAWDLGATEVCLQGGIDPQIPASHYLDLVRAIKAAIPEMHVHAFSPMEVATGAAHAGVSIPDFLAALQEAGLGSLPGTAAEILDDDVRWVLTKGKLPTATWIEVVESAHQLGLPTSSTMMFGHVDRPDHWLTHLRVLAAVQDNAKSRGRAGFTEFVPLPYVHQSAPLYLAGIGRAGPTAAETRAVHAAARLLLHGRIDHIQVSWVKLGADGSADDAQVGGRRPGRHAHGGDDQPDGWQRERLGHAGLRTGFVGRRGWPPGSPADHHLRPGLPRKVRKVYRHRRGPPRAVCGALTCDDAANADAFCDRHVTLRVAFVERVPEKVLTEGQRHPCNSTHVVRPVRGRTTPVGSRRNGDRGHQSDGRARS